MNLPAEPDQQARALTEKSPEAVVPITARIAAGLVLLTFVIFLPVVSCEFINYDDDVFVTNNPKVAVGLTWEGIKWAFTSADIDYWRPLSWLSHMLDIELFGVVAGGHHLINLLIHCAATMLAFLSLNRLTKSMWPSALVAALFAWHPLHVESVAWVAERKDVLCGFFWFFTLWAYARYVEETTTRNYLMVFCGFVLGVMSKPMIVTLPCVLLLLDYWPLKRTKLQPTAWSNPSARLEWFRTIRTLVAEKLLLFAVVVGLSLSTFYSQHQVGAMTIDADQLPTSLRLINAISAYATYLRQCLWPQDFSVLYPLMPIKMWSGITAAGVLALVSLICWRQRDQRPFLLMGWCWFLGVLVPVIGIIQVGEQAHANRYTYIPLVGIFIMLVWLGQDFFRGIARPAFGRSIAIGTLAGLALVTRSELQFWENGMTLFQRAADVTVRYPTVLCNLAGELRNRGRTREAIHLATQSLSIEPTQVAYLILYVAYYDLGDVDRALVAVNRAFQMDPRSKHAVEAIQNLYMSINNPKDKLFVHKALAIAHANRKELSEAVKQLESARKLQPDNLPLLIDLAAYHAAQGQNSEAEELLRKAILLNPTNSLAQANLGALLANGGQRESAINHYRLALAQDAKNPTTRHNLAIALIRTGRFVEAKAELQTVVAQTDYLPSLTQLAWLLATHAELRDAQAARGYASRAFEASRGKISISLLDIVAAAHAAAGDFDRALSAAEEALTLAQSEKATNRVESIRVRIESYRNHKPYNHPPENGIAP